MIKDGCYALPEDVTEVAAGAFANNKELRHIDLRNVRNIGADAFLDCTNLESVVMGKVSVIGPGAFGFCRSLRSVTFGSIEEIGDSAFSYCVDLDIPELPRSLAKIGRAAFSHTALRRADLHWLESIPPAVFSCCTSMTYADISGARVVGEDAFAGCRALSQVRFGGLEKICDRGFCKCGLLEIAALPETLRSIGEDALHRVRRGLVVPKSVRHFGCNCFGPVDTRKSVSIYRQALYAFGNYFRDERPYTEEDHFYLWESSVDVTVLDDQNGRIDGFLPLFSDLSDSMRAALLGAFRPDNTFDYSVLDGFYDTEMRWNQKGKDRLVVMRTKYPYELPDEVRAEYDAYLDKHAERMAMRAVREKDIETLSFLCDRGLIGSECVSRLTETSISLSASECTAILLAYQSELNAHYDPLIDEL